MHGNLVRGGRLKSFPGLGHESVTAEYRQPCVVFTGHPSLRCGDVVHFMELWANNVNNVGKYWSLPSHALSNVRAISVVFTEPSIQYQQALAPFQPMAMKVVHCPIDTSLNFTQAKKLIRDARPARLVMPHSYSKPPASAPGRQDLVIESDSSTTFTFRKNDVLKIPLVRKLGNILSDKQEETQISCCREHSDFLCPGC